MNEWQRLDDGSRVTYAGFQRVTHKQFRMNNGTVMNADIVGGELGEAAGVIALTPDNQVIIAKQYRAGPEKILFEMPGGAVDPGETPKQAALRELREEVGYGSDSVTYLGHAYVNAWSNVNHHYFLARDCYTVGGNMPEQFEEIEVTLIPISEFLQNAKESRMTDAQGVLLGYDLLKEISI